MKEFAEKTIWIICIVSLISGIVFVIFWDLLIGVLFFGMSFFMVCIMGVYHDIYGDDYIYECAPKTEKKAEKNNNIVKLPTSCPHCGAPMKSDTCNYCGSKSEIYKVIQ